MRVLSDYITFYNRYRHSSELVFVERSLVSSMVFVAAAVDAGTMDCDELAVYMRHHTAHAWEPDRIVFIDATSDYCFEKMRQRDRPSERTVSKAYINKLDLLYRQSPAAADIKIMPNLPETMVAQVLAALDVDRMATVRRHSF